MSRKDMVKQLDEKLTSAIENIAQTIKDHRLADSFELEIGVTPKFYRVTVKWKQPSVNGPVPMKLDAFLDRRGAATTCSILDPLALVFEQMCKELEHGKDRP